MAVQTLQLLANLAPQARLMVGAWGVERQVTGLTDLRGGSLTEPDPPPAGHAVALDAAAIPTGRDAQRALIARLRHVPLAVVQVADAAQPVPIGFLALAEQYEVPVVRWLPAHGQDPAAEIHAALHHVRPTVPELGAWARALATELDAHVHVLDARLRPLAGHPDASGSLLGRLRGELPPAAGHDPMFRTVLDSGGARVRVRSIAVGGGVRAVLLVTGRPLDTARLERLDRAAAELADHFNRRRPPAPHELLMLQAGIRLLAGHALRSGVWSKVVEEFRLPQAGPYAMLVLTGASPTLLGAALEECWGLGRWVTPCEVPEGMLLVARAEVFLDARTLVDGLAGHLTRPVHAGLASLQHRSELGVAYEQARSAARQAVRRQVPLVTHGELEWRDLVPATIDLAGVALLRARLLETLETAPGGNVLLTTLRTWVREEYRNDRTAAALGVHRHTLNNRLRRCERLLGAPLHAPDTSFGLWLLFHDDADPDEGAGGAGARRGPG
ncbi:helix-turn-helix domain-containing protein [Streptomyces sp. NPDC005900]|uniref:helix-turn-helix domain-containing protein n=1 Tax=Streptomyces sp. NPDC005900 TaxID=3154569 RepID=UPI0033F30EEE